MRIGPTILNASERLQHSNIQIVEQKADCQQRPGYGKGNTDKPCSSLVTIRRLECPGSSVFSERALNNEERNHYQICND